MSTVIMQQQSFYDFGDFMLKNQSSTQATPLQRSNSSQITSTVIGQQQKGMNINGGGNKSHQHQVHRQHMTNNHFLAHHQNMMNNNSHTNNGGYLNDKNNNHLVESGLDAATILGHPPSSPTNSSSSSMSTSSSGSSSNAILIDQQNLKHLIAQQIQQHHQHNQQKLLMHNALQRTVSHPHHANQMSYVNSLMDNLGTVGLSAANPIPTSPGAGSGCGDTISATHRKLERTQSEPLPQQQVNTSRYKTELCRPFEEAGECKYGDKCQFAHGYGELRNLQRHPRYKTELCRTFHSVGYCPYGPRCHFVHNAEEVRANQPPPPPPPSQQQQHSPQHNMISRTTSLQNGQQLTSQAPPNSFGLMGNLSPPMSMSTGSDRASPTGSLSLSPTNSMVSFFPDNSPFQTNNNNNGGNFPFAGNNMSSIIPSPPPSPREMSPSPHNHIISSSLSSSSSTSSVVSATTSCSSSSGGVTGQTNGKGKSTKTAPGLVDLGDARLPVFNRLSSTLESAFNSLEL